VTGSATVRMWSGRAFQVAGRACENARSPNFEPLQELCSCWGGRSWHSQSRKFAKSSTRLHHHHFICPIVQQYAHLRQYSWEEQDSRSDKNTNSCPKRLIQQLLGRPTTQVKYYKQTRKLEKSIFSVLFLKIFKDVNCTVDGRAFQTFITVS